MGIERKVARTANRRIGANRQFDDLKNVHDWAFYDGARKDRPVQRS